MPGALKNPTDIVGKRFGSLTVAEYVRVDIYTYGVRKTRSRKYVRGNIHWVHKDINLMKMDLPIARFVELCRAVAQYSDEQP